MSGTSLHSYACCSLCGLQNLCGRIGFDLQASNSPMETHPWFFLVGGMILIYGIILSPVLVSVYLVFRKGAGVSGRWVFVLAGPILAYTVAWMFVTIIALPVVAICVYLIPAIVQILGVRPYWLPIAEWVTQYWYLIFTAALGLMSAWVALYLWPRWPDVFTALAKRRSELTVQSMPSLSANGEP
jgi:hypothetical protein